MPPKQNDLFTLEDEESIFLQNTGNQLLNNAVFIPENWNPPLHCCEYLKTNIHLNRAAAKLSN